MAKSGKHYSTALDALRVIAILGVVLIHTTTKTLSASHFNLEKSPVTLLFNQASRFAVPLFFFISGFALELNYREEFDYKIYFQKRASRIILPYLAWSLFYILVVNRYSFIDFKSVDFIFRFIQGILVGGISYQLYFIPSLVIFYLLFPFIHQRLHVLSNKFILVFLTVIEILLLSQNYYLGQLTMPKPIRIAVLNYLIFIYGMIASHHKEAIYSFVRRNFVAISFTSLAIAIITSIQSGFLYSNSKNLEFIYEQFRPDMYVYTLLIFGIVYAIFKDNFWLHRILQKLSRLSYFVFYIHVFVLETIWEHFGQSVFATYITNQNIMMHTLFDVLFFGCVCSISFVIAYLFHKVPRLSSLTG